MDAQTKPPLRAALWLRVSTDDKGQDPTLQRSDVTRLCDFRGWPIVKEYLAEESAWVNKPRLLFRQMLEDAKNGLFDVIVAWSVDRFSREGEWAIMQNLLDLRNANVHFCSFSENFLDTTAGQFGVALIPLFGLLAQKQSQTKSESIRKGIAKARIVGTKRGKAIGRPKSSNEIAVIDAYKKTGSIRAAARIAQTKPGTAHGILCRAGLIERRKPSAKIS